MTFHLDLQVDTTFDGIPSKPDIERWAMAALGNRRENTELSVCIVGGDTSRELNARYRAQDKSTNVLSFPADLPAELNLPLLGDLVLCAPVIAAEAAAQNKALKAHWAHMIVHGTLHLLGYDHIKDDEAAIMEQLEASILLALGYSHPYENDETP